jgi:hypothetical protein
MLPDSSRPEASAIKTAQYDYSGEGDEPHQEGPDGQLHDEHLREFVQIQRPGVTPM